MKKTITALAFVIGLMFASIAQEKQKEWSAQIGLTNSTLDEETVVGVNTTSDYLDDFSVGTDVKIQYHISDMFSIGIGRNEITFDEDSFDPAESLSDLKMNATYISLTFSAPKRTWQGYGSIEIGDSDIDDVDVTYTATAFTNNIYEGESGNYFAFGGGVKYHINEDIFLDFSFRVRDYGTIQRNAVNYTAAIQDVDVVTSGFDIAFGIKF